MSEAIQSHVQILPIAEEHIESYHKCLDSVARERLYLAFVEAPPLDSSKAFVLSNIVNDLPQFVAVIDGEVIGWCDISPLKQEGFRHRGELAMGIHKRFRGMGIGRQLIASAIRKGKEKGLERIEIEVYASNVSAVRFYEHMGFVTEGIKRKARKIDGNYDDIVEMVLFV